MVIEAISNDEIKISAKKLAKCVFLECGDGKAQFSDNYFDLLPGETKFVKLSAVKPDILIDENAYKSIKIQSLRDL